MDFDKCTEEAVNKILKILLGGLSTKGGNAFVTESVTKGSRVIFENK